MSKLKEDNEVVSLGVQEQHQLRVAKAIRQQTVEKLWDITEKLNILYKDNWTALAEREMIKFQTELLAAQKKSLSDQKTTKASSQKGEEQEYLKASQEWSFAESFLYSLTLITTVGKNFCTFFNNPYISIDVQCTSERRQKLNGKAISE